ncbi:unnamed protein product [Microthlaspi erraticum]|uniref:Uncharacterized protein n=1 Tax=Microthlaspi erraticum TaxID=1685480 RepID=A0A6D2IZ93_9BRAS|nr:unnamed protein product [Microthlaspi erraticum]
MSTDATSASPDATSRRDDATRISTPGRHEQSGLDTKDCVDRRRLSRRSKHVLEHNWRFWSYLEHIWGSCWKTRQTDDFRVLRRPTHSSVSVDQVIPRSSD